MNPLFFQFFEILVRTTDRTEKNPPRFFQIKIRTTDRTRFEDGPNSGPRTGPTNLGPKIRYGPAVHDYDKLSCATSGGAGVIMIG